jgi:hypothetical protein
MGRGEMPTVLTALTAALAGVAAVMSLLVLAMTKRGMHHRRNPRLVRWSGRRLARASSESLTGLAIVIVGRTRRPALRIEWRSHLAGEAGRELSTRQKVHAALGFVRGAVKVRLRDLTDLAWIPVDRVLGSRTLSNLFVLVPTVIVGLVILGRAGTIGVMESMESITATGGVLYGLIQCGRWWRAVKPPEPKPRAKD